MNRFTPIFLAVLCALLAGFIIYSEKRWRSTDETRDQSPRMYRIPAGEISWISIKNPQDRILLKKAAGRWRIAEPVDLPADSEAIERLVRNLSNLDYVQQFDAADTQKGLEPYGLVPPSVVLRARWDGEEIELRLGARAPMGASVYAQSQKNVRRVYAINAGMLDTLSRPMSDWRSRKLVDFEPERVEEIRLANASGKIRLERRGDRWFLKSPLSARAAMPRVRDILGALGRAQIARFVSEDDRRLQDFGLKEPAMSVHLEVRDANDAEVQFGTMDPDLAGSVFARRPETSSIVSVSTNLMAPLSAGMEEFRDRRLIPVEAEAVERIVLTRGELRMEAVRESGAWNVVPPGELEMSPSNNEAVRQFIRRCCDLEAAAFVADAVTDPTSLGLDRPAARLEIWTKAGGEPSQGKPTAGGRRLDATLIIAPKQGNLHHCIVEPEPFVVGISEKDFENFLVQPWDWRSQSVWRMDSPINSISVKSGPTEYRLTKTRLGWVSDQRGNIDQGAADSIADLLARLQAQAWLGPTMPIEAEEPVATLTVGGNVLLRVWRAENRWIAWAEGAGAPDLFFELPGPEAALLTHPLLTPPRAPEPKSAQEPTGPAPRGK